MSSTSAILSRGALAIGAFVAIAVLGGSSPSAESLETATIDQLSDRAAALEHDIALLESEKAIEKLQRIYGFYTDKQLWSQAADLFATNGTIEVGGRGVYVGKEHVLAFLKLNGPEFPQTGRLFDQMQLQPIVHVAPDGLSAKGRWHMFAQEAVHGEYARWGLGVFENEYVKEGGVWKIQRLHLYSTMYTPYEDGWAKTALPNEGPSAGLPPDRPPSVDYKPFPAAYVVPFHYENPVTSAQTKRGPLTGAEVDQLAATVTRSVAMSAHLTTELDALEHRLAILEDLTQLERMNSIYGYYLAHLQWDDLTGIFSPTGTIEIAMRGVYAGLRERAPQPRSVRQGDRQPVRPAAQSHAVPARDRRRAGRAEREDALACAQHHGSVAALQPMDGRRLRERLHQREWCLEDQARPGVQHVFRAVHRWLENGAAAVAPRDHGVESARCAADASVRNVPEAVPAAVPLRKPGDGRDGRLDAATVSGGRGIVLDIFRALRQRPPPNSVSQLCIHIRLETFHDRQQI